MRYSSIVLGLLAGAASWGVVGLVSDRFEPFDSGTGFLVGQLILCCAALWVGYRNRAVDLVLYLVSAYLGMNGYSYAFGGSEQRAWAVLGLITTLGLVVFPALFGAIGKALGALRNRHGRGSSADPGSARD
jgi:hypothetical protein